MWFGVDCRAFAHAGAERLFMFVIQGGAADWLNIVM